MLKKGSKLYSILKQKCPRCHEGDFFVHKNPFRFKETLKLQEQCPSCGLNYMLEPSFFYGAMYVSYAFTVALSVAIFLIGHLLGLKLLVNLISIVVILLLLNTIIMRLSRLIYINMFVSYDKNVKN